MFGPRITTVFASRWKAVWWSACILATAYCTVPAPEDAASPAKAEQSPFALDQPGNDAPLTVSDDPALAALVELRRTLP